MKFINTLAIFAVLLFTACKKEKNIEIEVVPTGSFMMHLHTSIDSTEVADYATEYLTSEGRKMSLSMAQMFVSNIQLVKLDGTTYDVPNIKFLKVFEIEGYKIENVPVGNYKSIRFKVGLDATTNALLPTDPAQSFLLNHSEMWFSNPVQPDGYVFMNVQGTIDTTSAINGIPVSFSYKIGTNSNLISVVMPDHNFTISEGLITYSHMKIDYSMLFSGVQLNLASNLMVNSASENSNIIAAKISSNISSMFKFE
jgi:hypothetical protein